MLRQKSSHLQIVPQRGFKCTVSGGKYQQSSLFRRYTRYFGRTGYNNFTMPKAKTKGSKKRDGRNNGNLDGESAKETMLSEIRVSE